MSGGGGGDGGGGGGGGGEGKGYLPTGTGRGMYSVVQLCRVFNHTTYVRVKYLSTQYSNLISTEKRRLRLSLATISTCTTQL